VIDYNWLLNLAHQKSSNLKQLSKVTLREDGHTKDEEDEELHSDMSSRGNVTLKENQHILTTDWNYPGDIKLAFEQAGVSLKVVTTGRDHICQDADHNQIRYYEDISDDDGY
jgi:hypothetical protein